MKLLGVDIGNTLIKAHVYDGDQYLGARRFDRPVAFKEWFETQHEFDGIVVSTVNRYFHDEIQPLLVDRAKVMSINSQTRFPFPVKYKTPETLGSDRLIAAVGAVAEFPDKPLLILDAGSCFTYDVLVPGEGFLGGAISPGIEMRYKAMYHFTGSLPNIRLAYGFEEIGRTTEDCLHSGVQVGAIAEFKYRRSSIEKKFPGLVVVVTGGDLPFFEKHFKNEIFARPNLLPVGLKKIYDYNNGKNLV